MSKKKDRLRKKRASRQRREDRRNRKKLNHFALSAILSWEFIENVDISGVSEISFPELASEEKNPYDISTVKDYLSEHHANVYDSNDADKLNRAVGTIAGTLFFNRYGEKPTKIPSTYVDKYGYEQPTTTNAYLRKDWPLIDEALSIHLRGEKPPKKNEKVVRHCGICGKAGHIKSGCPDKDAYDAKISIVNSSGLDEYYGSDHWARHKSRQLKKDPYCSICGEIADEVDHLRYPPGINGGCPYSFDYREGDLRSVCRPCHRNFHHKKDKKEYSRRKSFIESQEYRQRDRKRQERDQKNSVVTKSPSSYSEVLYSRLTTEQRKVFDLRKEQFDKVREFRMVVSRKSDKCSEDPRSLRNFSTVAAKTLCSFNGWPIYLNMCFYGDYASCQSYCFLSYCGRDDCGCKILIQGRKVCDLFMCLGDRSKEVFAYHVMRFGIDFGPNQYVLLEVIRIISEFSDFDAFRESIYSKDSPIARSIEMRLRKHLRIFDQEQEDWIKDRKSGFGLSSEDEGENLSDPLSMSIDILLGGESAEYRRRHNLYRHGIDIMDPKFDRVTSGFDEITKQSLKDHCYGLPFALHPHDISMTESCHEVVDEI